MGYSPSRQLVRDNQKFLATVLRAVQNQEEIAFPCSDPQEMKTRHWKMRQVLKSAEAYSDEFKGIFKDLASSVKITQDYKRLTISVVPRSDLVSSLGEIENERHALMVLSAFQGSLAPLSFYPSETYNEVEFAKHVERRGFRLSLASKHVEEDGRINFVAERIEARRGSLFDSIGSPDEREA